MISDAILSELYLTTDVAASTGSVDLVEVLGFAASPPGVRLAKGPCAAKRNSSGKYLYLLNLISH